MSEAILKPCPFCGGKAILRSHGLGTFVVQCENRFAESQCPVNGRTRSGKAKDEAVTLWNTRIEEAA